MLSHSVAIDLTKVRTVRRKDYEAASNKKRASAFTIDSLVFAGIQVMIPGGYDLFSTLVNFSLPGVVTSVAFIFCYWVLPTHVWGGTPGKLALGLRVLNADYSKQVSLEKLLLRETVGRLANIVSIGLGYAWVLWDKDRRTFHDMIAKTRVIEYK